MLIILEGMDNIGKSTQARYLTEYFHKNGYLTLNLHYHHMPTFTEDDSFYYYRWQATIMQDLINSKIVICDRFHLGEYVYGHLYRSYKNAHDNFINIDNIVSVHHNAYLFLFEDSVQNVVDRDDNMSISNDFNMRMQEKMRFKDAFNLSNIKNKFVLNVNDEYNDWLPKEQMFNFIKEKIEVNNA